MGAFDATTSVTDGVTDNLAQYHNELKTAADHAMSAAAYAAYGTPASMTGNVTLTDASLPILSYAPTAARDLTLPAVATTNHAYYVINRSGTYAITVKDAAAATITTVAVNSTAFLVSDGANSWYPMGGGLTKAAAADVATGTDDAKYVTAKAIKDSVNVPNVSPVGGTGNVLTSNGTAWTSAAASASPTTGKNAIINGNFQVSQRGTTFTSATTPANSDDTYLLDRWILLSDGNDIVDVSQEQSATITDPPFNIKLDVETANKKFGIITILEQRDSRQLINQSVSLSFKAKRTGATIAAIRAGVLSWSSTADTVTSDVVNAWGGAGTNPTVVANWTFENTPADLAALTTSWQTFKIENIAIDTASATNIAVFIWTDDVTMDVADFLHIADVKLEIGATATTFDFINYNDTLLLCKRYYEKIMPGVANGEYAAGFYYGTSLFVGSLYYTPKRVIPTISFSATADFLVLYSAATTVSTGNAVNNVGFASCQLSITTAAITAGIPARFIGTANATHYISIDSAEL